MNISDSINAKLLLRTAHTSSHNIICFIFVRKHSQEKLKTFKLVLTNLLAKCKVNTQKFCPVVEELMYEFTWQFSIFGFKVVKSNAQDKLRVKKKTSEIITCLKDQTEKKT